MEVYREPTVKANISDDEIVNIINESIKNGTSISVSRCGDGEMHLLKNENDFATNSDKIIHHASMISILKRNAVFNCTKCRDEKGYLVACRCYLHDKASMDWVNSMRHIIVKTINESDYIGLNCPKVDQRWYGISRSVLERYHINVDALKITTSDWPKHPLIGDPIEFKKTLDGLPIHIITSKSQNFKRINFASHIGSPITYTSLNDEEDTKNMSYYQREELINSLGNIKEKVVLLGGGAYIKDMIPMLKNDFGKTCIDMGSVLDIWSGVLSRKVFLRESKHCNWLNVNK